MSWPTYIDSDDVERCAKCRHACRMHEQICFGQDWGWARCTCGLLDESDWFPFEPEGPVRGPWRVNEWSEHE